MQCLFFFVLFISSTCARSNFSHIPIDSVQEFWDSRPCNIHHSNKLLSTKEYFDEVEQRK